MQVLVQFCSKNVKMTQVGRIAIFLKCFAKITKNYPQLKKKKYCLIVIFEAFRYTFHPIVVFTDHNIKTMQNKNQR